jgi:hypothetical protein
MAGNFKAQVAAWARKSDARLNAVFRESAQRLISQAQTVRGEGGKMRIDTGFLRASGQASLIGWPSGPSMQSEGLGSFDYAVTIAGARLGQTIYFGWTAEYAGFREYEDGFMRSAAQNWQNIVSTVVREAMARFP